VCQIPPHPRPLPIGKEGAVVQKSAAIIPRQSATAVQLAQHSPCVLRQEQQPVPSDLRPPRPVGRGRCSPTGPGLKSTAGSPAGGMTVCGRRGRQECRPLLPRVGDGRAWLTSPWARSSEAWPKAIVSPADGRKAGQKGGAPSCPTTSRESSRAWGHAPHRRGALAGLRPAWCRSTRPPDEQPVPRARLPIHRRDRVSERSARGLCPTESSRDSRSSAVQAFSHSLRHG
jgi:hypothetical protein